jgi:hypothetical protein
MVTPLTQHEFTVRRAKETSAGRRAKGQKRTLQGKTNHHFQMSDRGPSLPAIIHTIKKMPLAVKNERDLLFLTHQPELPILFMTGSELLDLFSLWRTARHEKRRTDHGSCGLAEARTLRS